VTIVTLYESKHANIPLSLLQSVVIALLKCQLYFFLLLLLKLLWIAISQGYRVACRYKEKMLLPFRCSLWIKLIVLSTLHYSSVSQLFCSRTPLGFEK